MDFENSNIILVTGANTGIGLALVKILIADHNCCVFLGSRSLENGEAAVKNVIDEIPSAASKIKLLQIDVSDDASVKGAADLLKSQGVVLYGLVNNAGVGFQTDPGSADALLNTNYHGVNRVTEAMIDLMDPKKGRIVNCSSGAASMFVRNLDAAKKNFFSSPDITKEELDAEIKKCVADSIGKNIAYGLSKAGVCSLTMIQAKKYKNLVAVSLSPGFINTRLVQGFGATLTPAQGCVSYVKCLFGNVVSGYYYGSDGLRSPLTVTRDPGTPEYQGEDNPDPKRYNK